MKKLMIAMAIVLGLNLVSSMVGTTSGVSYAQDNPDPQPQPKPEKPDPE